MIPVRMASTRLPNKPLLEVNGKTVIQRVYENVKASVPGDIIIAAGDQVLVDEAKKFGATAILTDPKLPSGTDRIAAALKQIDPDGTKYDIVVDFQGDGLNVDPKVNLDLIDMIERTDCDIATCGMVFKNDIIISVFMSLKQSLCKKWFLCRLASWKEENLLNSFGPLKTA